MSDIALLIKIPEEIYKASQILNVKHEDVIQIPLEVITNGIPLPKEPCEDYVSRQAVINTVANTCFWLSADNWEELMKSINSISPVTLQKMALKALEQDDALDKIRAEIQKKQHIRFYIGTECH